MGIALRPSDPAFDIVKTYYDVAKREPTRRGDLEIGSTAAYKGNFLDLVRTLAAKQQSHVVIATHGTADGTLLPLTDKTTSLADDEALQLLAALVDDYPKFDASSVTTFATTYSVTEAEVKELVKVCSKIRKHQANCVAVHIRGCNIGVKDDNLWTIQKLFDSLVVSAPECPMLYAQFNPEWSRPQDKDVGAWKSANTPASRRREFADPSAGLSTLVLDVNYAGSTSSTQGVIQHADDLTKWANVFYKNKSHGTQRHMPIAAMWPDTGYALPHEQGYIDQINAVRK
jgi:hypothetical protein